MPEKNKDEKEVDNNEEALEGTGMGEGDTRGAEDVSEQIEDEEQLLGLETDQKQQELEGEQEDNGVEMSADFEGDLVDIEQKENDQDEDEEDEEEEEEDMDREMGDFDAEDENIVDERLWNSDDDEENEGKDNEKEENFDPKSVHGGESEEMRAKDEEDEDDNSNDPQTQDGIADEKEEVEEEENKDNDKTNDENEGEAQDEEETEDRAGVDLKDAKEENETYEIPDEMDMQEDENNQEEEEEEKEEGNGEEVEGQDEEEVKEGEDENKEENEEVKDQVDASAIPLDDEDEDENDPEAEKEKSDVRAENEMELDEEDKKDDEDEENNEQQQQQQDEMENDVEENDDDTTMKDTEDTDAGQKTKNQRRDEYNLQDEEENQDEQDESSSSKQQGASSSGKGEYHEGIAPPQNDQQDSKKDKKKKQPNPLKDLEAAIHHWKREIQSLEKGEDDEDNEDAGEENEDNIPDAEAVMHSKNKNSESVLAAHEEDDDAMEEVSGDDEDEKEDVTSDHTEKEKKKESKVKERIEDDDKMEVEEEEDENKLSKSSKNRWESLKSTFKEEKEEEKEEEEEEGDSNMDDVQEEYGDAKDMNDVVLREQDNIISTPLEYDNDYNVKIDDDDDFIELLQSGRADENLYRRQIEELNEHRQNLSPGEGIKKWRELQLSTQAASTQLCEQLRLIFEPTDATRMRGSYRTGKRINMRAIIPFVASNFRKDKIWLRRTMPSKRRYQVVLAIDDSRSMMPCKRMACEVVSTVCTSLTLLEIGDVGICSFGENFRILHSLDQAFSDNAAASVLEGLSFTQDHSNFVTAVKSVMNMLSCASNNATTSSGTPTQLVFLISDGKIMKDRERLARLVREAERMQKMIVLVIVDSDSQSIFDLNSVDWKDGKMQINSYLDKYPFVYYVVVQRLDLLADVISDALRQWFELIKQASE